MPEVDWDRIYELLDELWDGPFDTLRIGQFSLEDFAKIQQNMSQIDIPDTLESYPAKFVQEVWFLPTFLGWQKDRVCENNPNLCSDYEGLCRWVVQRIGYYFGEKNF